MFIRVHEWFYRGIISGLRKSVKSALSAFYLCSLLSKFQRQHSALVFDMILGRSELGVTLGIIRAWIVVNHTSSPAMRSELCKCLASGVVFLRFIRQIRIINGDRMVH